VLAEQQYDTMSLQEGQIFAYLKDMDISLPACWGSCPYMVKAMANPIDISSFDLPRPADVKVAAMVHALERLLERQLTYLAMGYPTDFDGESLFRMSWSIIALCLEPAMVIDLNTDPTLWPVGEPALARFLLAAIKADYVNSVKRTYTIIVSMIANSLGLDASRVYHTHPFLRDDEEANLTWSTLNFILPPMPHHPDFFTPSPSIAQTSAIPWVVPWRFSLRRAYTTSLSIPPWQCWMGLRW